MALPAEDRAIAAAATLTVHPHEGLPGDTPTAAGELYTSRTGTAVTYADTSKVGISAMLFSGSAATYFDDNYAATPASGALVWSAPIRIQSNPPTNVYDKFLLARSNTTAFAGLEISSAGKLRVKDGANALKATSNLAIGVDAWYRVKAKFTTTSVTVRIFDAADALLETLGPVTVTAGNPNGLRTGLRSVSGPILIDEVQTSDDWVTELPPPPKRALGHVFVIMGENKSLAQVTGTPSKDPYILQTLKPQGAWFTGYNSLTTGSLSQYIAITSGQYAECQRQGPCGKFAIPSIFSQLGIGNWKAWMESMPSRCYTGKFGSMTTHNFYKDGHNPALWYTDLNPTCPTYDVPAGTTGWDDMSYFNSALAAGSVPTYNFISPNGCEGGYQTCTNKAGVTVNPVAAFDNFLRKEIPLIQGSPAYGSDSLIVITFDEGQITQTSRGTSTMLLVLGPQVVPGTYDGYYDHYSTLATTQEGLGLPCLAGACTATPLPIFRVPVVSNPAVRAGP